MQPHQRSYSYFFKTGDKKTQLRNEVVTYHVFLPDPLYPSLIHVGKRETETQNERINESIDRSITSIYMR